MSTLYFLKYEDPRDGNNNFFIKDANICELNLCEKNQIQLCLILLFCLSNIKKETLSFNSVCFLQTNIRLSVT